MKPLQKIIDAKIEEFESRYYKARQYDEAVLIELLEQFFRSAIRSAVKESLEQVEINCGYDEAYGKGADIGIYHEGQINTNKRWIDNIKQFLKEA